MDFMPLRGDKESGREDTHLQMLQGAKRGSRHTRGFLYSNEEARTMENQRFTRLIPLVGDEAFDKIQHTHVAVFGVGGVGSYATEALARSAIGRLTLVDFDDIAIHNINRQIHALTSTVGRKKVDVMAERLKDINPHMQVDIFSDKVSSDNIEKFFQPRPDYILDAIDDVEAKIALILYSREQKIPLISSMGTGNKLDPSALEVTDISQTSVCPLCRSVRRRLRQQGVEKGVNVVYSQEQPKTKGILAEGRPVPASSCLVPPAAGLLMASWVINDLVKSFNKKENQ